MLFPAEPLLLAVAGGLVWEGRGKIFNVLKTSRLAMLVAAWFAWLAVTAAFSTLPLVSWKYSGVEFLHGLVFFAGFALFPGLWRRVLPLFLFSLAGVALYAILRHGLCFHFRVSQSALAALPFFADHTIFGAVLVMAAGAGAALPAGSVLFAQSSRRAAQRYEWFIGALFLLAFVLTFSRAAWLSAALAGFAGAMAWASFRWRAVWALAGLSVLCAAWFFRAPLSNRLAADVSTQERLNRYSCARRMAADRPWTGFGPGTFAFQYLAYQRREEMTRISVSAPIARRGPGNYGRGGGAHSEYLQAWAEGGLPGFILWNALALAALSVGYGAFRRAATRPGKWMALFATLSLLSFLLHAGVNNFLHDARVAALFWGQLGILVRSGD